MFISNYLDDKLDQTVFLDVDYLKVLDSNTFEYCLYELITKRIDLSVFDTLYKNQVSFLLEALDNTNYLDLMKNKTDSDQGK